MALSFFGHKKQQPPKTAVVEIPLTAIVPNRFQPRKVFSAEGIAELAETIKEHGLLQPIVVREYESGKYEIIAGERRFRALESLHFEKAPAIVQKMSDEESAAMALIENLQREGLSAIEEAQAYVDLMHLNSMTQQQLAERLGKSQSFVANKLRLLKLSDSVQDAIMNGEITERHGRELLKLDDYQQQLMLHQILANDLTVKETHQAIAELQAPKPVSQPQAQAQPEAKAETKPAASQKEPAKTPRHRRRQKQVVSRDARLAVNTLHQSLKLIKDSGMHVESSEQEDDQCYRLVIEIPKDQK